MSTDAEDLAYAAWDSARRAAQPERSRRTAVRTRRRWTPQPQRGLTTVIRCRTNAELLARTEPWWNVGPNMLDVTYGRGGWWRNVRPESLVGHDVRTDGVNFCALPEGDGTQDAVFFDPDYVSTGGRDTVGASVLDFVDRYGLRYSARTPALLREMNMAGMTEAVRVLRPGGRLVMKCSDYVSSGLLQLEHVRYQTYAVEGLGLRPRALVVHWSGTGPQPKLNLDGTPRRQVHPRAAHSYLAVWER